MGGSQSPMLSTISLIILIIALILLLLLEVGVACIQSYVFTILNSLYLNELISNIICHPYHIVDESPWPIFGSIGGLYLTTGIVRWFHLNSLYLFFIGLILLGLVITQW